MGKVSNGFQLFMAESKESGQAFMNLVQKLDEESSFDKKTGELVYIGILAAVGMAGGLPFHVLNAKKNGASRDEIKSAVLSGFPAVGLKVVETLAMALNAYDEE